MLSAGVSGNTITFNAAFAACEMSQRWELALDFYNLMRKERIPPDHITFHSVVSCCASLGKKVEASQVLRDMADAGCVSAKTYTSYMALCMREDCWSEAVEVYDEMVRLGGTPSAHTYAVLIAALQV